jgi:hypothetical protein
MMAFVLFTKIWSKIKQSDKSTVEKKNQNTMRLGEDEEYNFEETAEVFRYNITSQEPNKQKLFTKLTTYTTSPTQDKLCMDNL